MRFLVSFTHPPSRRDSARRPLPAPPDLSAPSTASSPTPTIQVRSTRVRSDAIAKMYDFCSSCFAFSSQYLSTEQEDRQRPQTRWKDSANFWLIPVMAPVAGFFKRNGQTNEPVSTVLKNGQMSSLSTNWLICLIVVFLKNRPQILLSWFLL